MTGRLAAAASSRRRTGVVYGALRAIYGIVGRLREDLGDRLGERVERLARLGLGRLDQQRLVDEQREVDRRRVEAVVEQALGEVRASGCPSARFIGPPESTNSCMQVRS